MKKSCWIISDEVCSRWNFSSNIFWFIKQYFHVGCIWVHFHPSLCLLTLRWMQSIYNGAYLERSNVFFFIIKAQRSQFLSTGNYRQGKAKKTRANNMARGSDDEINTMKVSATFITTYRKRKKGKKIRKTQLPRQM